MSKGGHWDRLIYTERTARYLTAYLIARKELTNGNISALWVSTRADGRGNALTLDGLKAIIRKWGNPFNLFFGPHDLRRSFATQAIRNGADMRIVQKAGRWSSLEMVVLYTNAIEAAEIEPYLPLHNLDIDDL